MAEAVAVSVDARGLKPPGSISRGATIAVALVVYGCRCPALGSGALPSRASPGRGGRIFRRISQAGQRRTSPIAQLSWASFGWAWQPWLYWRLLLLTERGCPMRRQAVLIALVLALSVFGGSAVEASPITYYFSGTVAAAIRIARPPGPHPVLRRVDLRPGVADRRRTDVPRSRWRVFVDNGQRQVGVCAGVCFLGNMGHQHRQRDVVRSPLRRVVGAGRCVVRPPGARGLEPGGRVASPAAGRPRRLLGLPSARAFQPGGARSHGGGRGRRLLLQQRRRVRRITGARTRVAPAARHRAAGLRVWRKRRA